MIYLLKNLVEGNTIFLIGKNEFSIGRKNCDILLEKDQSISRNHAIIRISVSHCTIEDCQSKYHTLLNGKKLEANVETKLTHMDLLHFGEFNSKFSFEAYKFMSAASALSNEKKNILRENIKMCNGKYVEKWSKNCTHLTVEKITLTVKVLQALIDEKPLVLPEYWSDYAKSIQNKTAPPDLNKYNKPPVAEQLLRSDFQYKLDPRRKHLFVNKVFVFLNSTIKKQMEDVINSCGGESMSWKEDGPKTFYDICKSAKEYLFIKTDNDEENVSFNALLKDMAKEKKRAIPLNEIALAILHCSCDINCNPNFNKVTEVFGARTQKQQTMGILVGDTQTEQFVPQVIEMKTEKIIPASNEDNWALETPRNKECHIHLIESSGVKRPTDDTNDTSIIKKPKVEEEVDENKIKKDVLPTTYSKDMFKASGKLQAEKKCTKEFTKSQKRKAEEILEKPDAKKMNPFNLIKINANRNINVKEEDNPFELTRSSSKSSKLSKSLSSRHENPFAFIPNFPKSTIEVKDEISKSKDIGIKEFKSMSKTTDTSVVHSRTRSFLNTTWLSKSSKSVINVEKTEDPELLEILEAFKNCVKVETLPVFNRTNQSRAGLNNSSFDCVDGKKNFKKFKKVKLVRPQMMVIPRSRFAKVAPGETVGIEINDLNESEDERDPVNMGINQKLKPKVKKFIL